MSVRANLLKDRGFAANSIPITPSAKKIVLTKGNKVGFIYQGAPYLMQRNQFLRLFLCEREIIVNALFLLKCLGNGFRQIQVQRYKYYLKINNILWKRIYKETNNAFFQ